MTEEYKGFFRKMVREMYTKEEGNVGAAVSKSKMRNAKPAEFEIIESDSNETNKKSNTRNHR